MEENRKSRVKRIKIAIVTAIIILLLLPSVICSILFREFCKENKKLNDLEKRVEELTDKVDSYSSVGNEETKVIIVDGKEQLADPSKKDLSDETSGDNVTMSLTGGNSTEVSDKNKVYLTFDDGPGDNTDRILDILAEYGVKATFFTVGKKDENSVSHYKRIVREGHTLAMHSYSHKYSSIYASKEAFIRDYKKISKLVRKYTGEKPIFYRFPGGSSNSVCETDMLELIDFLNEEGVTYFDWNVASGDAESTPLTAEEIYTNVISGIEGKTTSVILMHDLVGKESTVEALPQILEKLQSDGYEILPIDENTEVIHHTVPAH